MHLYEPPVNDFQFIIHKLLKVQNLKLKGYSDLSPDFTKPIFEEAGKLAREELAPINISGDKEGCILENGVVRTPKGFKEAFLKVNSGGWTGIDCDPEFGGQGMPHVISLVIGEMFCSANMALNMYHGLTHGAYSAIYQHGNKEQKSTYLPNLVNCKWTGTMNLTEPHCGTDLGLIKTKAQKSHDGSYQITGQKIFISAGDHDLSENIIHLVLAKIPGSPEGVKGISMFIVPKFLINEDGSLGERNTLSVSKIEEKMGIHGNSTCVMNYDGAKGFLISEENKGLRAMFTMMNEARLGVGLQGIGQAEAAYQRAAAYAKERLQGKDISKKDGSKNADPIIQHPDIRRTLMDQKVFIEAARALALWCATMLDFAEREGDKESEGLASLLIPVVKGFITDKGFESTINSQQVFGGHGYIEEWGMSQFARDARIAMIYEGTNGIQALDLVGRKLSSDGGKHTVRFLKEIKDFISENKEDDRIAENFITPLNNALKDAEKCLEFFMKEGLNNPNQALAGATDFMHLMGYLALGFMWARMVKVALDELAQSKKEDALLNAKVSSGRYFFRRHLPETSLRKERVLNGSEDMMELRVEDF